MKRENGGVDTTYPSDLVEEVARAIFDEQWEPGEFDRTLRTLSPDYSSIPPMRRAIAAITAHDAWRTRQGGMKGITMDDATETNEVDLELEAVGLEEIPVEVLTALVATGREFVVTRSVTYSVGYMDVENE